ncbi:anaphase-promoting complex, cyclosome, subunit 4-domain-containing protein [Gigaspora rosea]|uniref:Anaphase-promoting complex subunit 4 n=1 Tax=Gigaspora rosea TaxID=44941 RepID=A0A397V3X5_9GLOM|nr:anaphase-promoting complex, cyclosome, subunit 4-domain-containing protein [Gigaspora rosea]
MYNSIRLMSMCPTMDLLAVCTESGSVWVARWYNALEKIWTLPPSQDNEETVEVFTWRPEGKVIAIGYSNGIIRLYNVDKLEMIHELFQKPLKSPSSKSFAINFLFWVQETKKDSEIMNDATNDFSMSAHPVQKYLPRLNTMPHAKPISKLLGDLNESDEDDLDDRSSSSIDLLLAGDAGGNLHLSVYGIYNLQPISLSQHIQLKNTTIIKASVTPDLSLITLLIRTDDYSTSSASTGFHKDRLFFVTFNTGLLYTQKLEIRTLSQRYTAIKYLTDYIFKGIKQIESEYQDLKLLTNKFVESFQEEAKSKLSAEFARLLATGKPSALLEEYMESHLTKRALKDWESKGQKIFDQMREYVNHYVRIGCERLIIELNALVGYSKWPQKFQKLGLDESFIHSCVILAGCIISRLEKLNSIIDEEYINFLEFHQWLQFEFDNITSLEQNTNHEASPRVDVHKVSSYIKNSLGKDFLNNLEKFFVDDQQSSTISLPTFEFPFSSCNSDNCNIFQQNSSHNNELPAYPYDFLSSNNAFQRAPSFESFVTELINRCDILSSTTADNVAKSVKAHELVDIVEGINYCIDNIFLADMRIVAEV